MPTKTTEATRNVASFRNDDERWEAVRRRDRAADGALLLFGAHDRRLLPAVLRARLPRRENVAFHATRAAAEARGLPPLQALPAERARRSPSATPRSSRRPAG